EAEDMRPSRRHRLEHLRDGDVVRQIGEYVARAWIGTLRRHLGVELLNVSPVLAPVITACVADRADQPVMQVANFVRMSEIRDEDLVRESFGVYGGNLKFPHRQRYYKAAVFFINAGKDILVDGTGRRS